MLYFLAKNGQFNKKKYIFFKQRPKETQMYYWANEYISNSRVSWIIDSHRLRKHSKVVYFTERDLLVPGMIVRAENKE